MSPIEYKYATNGLLISSASFAQHIRVPTCTSNTFQHATSDMCSKVKYGSVCTTQRHVIWPTSVCRRRLRTAVASLSLCTLRGPPGALDSDVYWPAQLCCVWPQDLEPTTNGPPITRTVARFIQAPAQDPPVPALDSAGCSCGCRVPSSGAVVTAQRVRRRLQMSRLDSTLNSTLAPLTYLQSSDNHPTFISA